MSSSKSCTSRLIFPILLFVTACTSNAQEVTSANQVKKYSCPGEFSFEQVAYPLFQATVFDGPIQEQASLVPEFSEKNPGLAHWNDLSSDRTTYLQCRYKDIGHFIVLEAAGAKVCEALIADGKATYAFCQ